MASFAPLGSVDVSLEEFHQSLKARYISYRPEFPRCFRPVHNQKELRIRDSSTAQESDHVNPDQSSHSDGDNFKPQCERCGMEAGDARCDEYEDVLMCQYESEGTRTLVCESCCF